MKQCIPVVRAIRYCSALFSQMLSIRACEIREGTCAWLASAAEVLNACLMHGHALRFFRYQVVGSHEEIVVFAPNKQSQE